MISEIQVNPPVATYADKTSLGDLRRINFIFGANGTGKTTIGRVIAQAEGHEHCGLVWEGGTPLERMVYNRDFVDRNFNQNSPLKGVFTLGENQVEAEKKIAVLQPEIDRTIGEISSLNIQLTGEDGQSGKRKEIAGLEPALREECWKQKKLHDDYFQVAFSGLRNSADRFKDKVLEERVSNSADALTLDELKEKARTVFSSNVERVSALVNLSADSFTNSERDALLKKVVVGNQDVNIAVLIDRLGNSDWVKQGLKYHAKEPNTCPFCQQPTDNHFADSLSAFFSEAYDNDIQALKRLQIDYQRTSEQLVADVHRNAESNNPFLNVELFSAEAQGLFERLERNQSILGRKLDEPSRKFELEPVEQFISELQRLISEANESANRHNATVDNIAAEKRKLTSQVWRYVLNELDGVLRQYQQAKERLGQAIQGMEQSLIEKQARLRELQSQVKALEAQTTSIQPTITAINDLLKRFGFYSFSIGDADEGRHYRIVRANGEDASHSLSEGEKTFITFLYFYHLIRGAQSPSGVTTNRVVVFDDPISSLDSDILYIVSSLIKSVMDEARGRSGRIKQVFVLTHNVYFHKEITFNRRRPLGGVLNEESFWMVKKRRHWSAVVRCGENPIQSAYELLWEDVKSANVSSVSLQNTLRRILENYFTMWGGMDKDDICAIFEGRDKLICQSLFSWVNDGSHFIHDDLYVNHGEQTNESYLRVFGEVFRRAGQEGHYKMMMGVNASEEEESLVVTRVQEIEN